MEPDPEKWRERISGQSHWCRNPPSRQHQGSDRRRGADLRAWPQRSSRLGLIRLPGGKGDANLRSVFGADSERPMKLVSQVLEYAEAEGSVAFASISR